MNDQTKRPIDRRRNAAVSMSIGSTDGDGEIVEMISIDSRLHTIMENAVYAIQLADDVDPARTNESIQNNQQRVLAIGANDPIVGKLILTANVLFKHERLGENFAEDNALSLAWILTKHVAAMATIHLDLSLLQSDAITTFEESEQSGGSLRLPSIESLDAQFDAFSQKLGHAVDVLKELCKLFYEDLPKKWIDGLIRLTLERYGADHPFSNFANEAGPVLLFMREMRNMIEHPKPDRRVVVFDFRQLPTGEILPPSVEIVAPGEDASPISATELMSQLIDDLVAIAEALFAHLCGVKVQPFGRFEIGISALPENQRSHVNVQMSYVTYINGEWVRFG